VNVRLARTALALLAAAAAVSVSLTLVGAAGAAVIVNCAPYGAQTAADVQTAANGGGIVNIRGVCPGRVTLTTPVTLAGLTPGATSGLDATSAPGAPVITVNATPVTLSNLLVTGGVNSGDGGGVWDICGWSACGGGVLNITNSRVIGNKVTGGDSWGAGINAESNTTVNVKGTQVTGNTTTAPDGNGAGIASDDAAAVSVVGSFVSANTSQAGNGGGIFIRGSGSLSVTSSTVSNNTAGEGGGGIAASGSFVHLLKSNVVGNKADHGGGVLEEPGLDGGPSPVLGVLTVDSVAFDHNQAQTTGGGLMTSTGCGAGSLLVIVQASTVTNNSTVQPVAGGGGYAQSTGCGAGINSTFTDTLFSANGAPGADGGAISNTSDDFFSDSSVTLQQSSQPHQLMSLQNNQAAVGAGVYNSGQGSILTLRFGAKVTHNHASLSGGGVFDVCGSAYVALPGAQNVFNTPNNFITGSCV